MRFFITGGAGFIGSHLAERILDRGDEVIVLDDLSTGRMANIEHLVDRPGFSYRIGCATDGPLVVELVDRADLTFHLAGLELEADRQYGFRFAFTGYGCVYNARIDLLHAADDAYPDGLAVQTAGTIATPLGFDLVFFVHGADITCVIFTDGFESGDTSMWSNGPDLPWEHDRAAATTTATDR